MKAIEVSHLSKSFDIYKRPIDRIKQVVAFNKKTFYQRFWALKNISFSVSKGTTIGVLGQNGSGKSTLLKILAGLMLPSEGEIKIIGKTSSLIELGMGFHTEFSGKSNVYLNSALLGISKEEIDAKFNQIVEFSGIGDFIDRPVKTYSSGMYLRLAFSVAISINPEILLIDEVLAVGDALFSQKCVKKLREFQEQDTTIVFVSHDMGAIKNLCDEAILLDKGVLVERGDPGDISDYYNALIQKRYAEETKQITFIQRIEDEKERKKQRYGNFDAMILDIKLLSSSGEEIGAILSGEDCVIMVKAIFFEDVENAVVGILIRDRLGNEVFGTNTGYYQQNTGIVTKDEMMVVNFTLKMNIGSGDYSVTAAVHPDKLGLEGHFDWVDRAISFKVLPSEPRFIGLSKLNPHITVQRMKRISNLNSDNPLNMVFPNAVDHIEMGEGFQSYLIKGWHQPEMQTEGYIRWTHKNPSFIMKISGRKLRLEVSTSKPNIAKEPITGDIFCNGIKIGNFILNEYGWKRLDLEIKEELKGEVARFKLSLNRTWRPDDFFRNGDKRELGISVRRIWCEE
ncbi:MAG: ABC transporter ATP-binding protein [Syntrophaceae bacterium]|nr:ABC transporter ATP-binding protein [Syntrophaceae bacterium]